MDVLAGAAWLPVAAVVGGALLINALALWYLRSRTRTAGHQPEKEELAFAAATEQVVGDINEGVAGLGAAVQGTQQRIADLERQFRLLDNSALQVTRRHGVERAILLARQGTASDEIAHLCGLSVAEARLLSQVHAGLHSH